MTYGLILSSVIVGIYIGQTYNIPNVEKTVMFLVEKIKEFKNKD